MALAGSGRATTGPIGGIGGSVVRAVSGMSSVVSVPSTATCILCMACTVLRGVSVTTPCLRGLGRDSDKLSGRVDAVFGSVFVFVDFFGVAFGVFFVLRTVLGIASSVSASSVSAISASASASISVLSESVSVSEPESQLRSRLAGLFCLCRGVGCRYCVDCRRDWDCRLGGMVDGEGEKGNGDDAGGCERVAISGVRGV